MDPLVVLVADAQLDLSPLTQKLWAERIPHRVVLNEEGKQCLLLASMADSERVYYWIEQWRTGSIEQATVQSPQANRKALVFLAITACPISFAFILMLMAVFAWQHFSLEWQSWIRLGAASWPEQRNQLAVYFSMGFWELWRPAVLHFSLSHLLFNSFWWWILASKIEHLEGIVPLCILVLLCGLGGNAMQWWYMGPNFGGASGITMGLLGWVGVRLTKVPYQFPRLMLPIMVGIVLITITADTLLQGVTHTAHGAHIGGLIVGLLLGLAWPKQKHES